jgi:APA family basic amino acid/polyamine antiporter
MPVYSIFFQAALAMLLVLTASFEKLLFYIGFTLSLFALCTVIGLIILRKTKPSLARPYKTWGYPVTPLVFILGNLWIILFSIGNKPVVALYGLGTIAVGSLVYLLFKKMQAGREEPESVSAQECSLE